MIWIWTTHDRFKLKKILLQQNYLFLRRYLLWIWHDMLILSNSNLCINKILIHTLTSSILYNNKNVSKSSSRKKGRIKIAICVIMALCHWRVSQMRWYYMFLLYVRCIQPHLRGQIHVTECKWNTKFSSPGPQCCACSLVSGRTMDDKSIPWPKIKDGSLLKECDGASLLSNWQQPFSTIYPTWQHEFMIYQIPK